MNRFLNKRARAIRDDFVVDPMSPVDPTIEPVGQADVLVSGVESVEPMTKRYRATVSRTITQTTVVEFDASETADLYTIAEELLPQIPADAWASVPSDSFGYIDKIEEAESAPVSPDAELDDEIVDEEEDPVEPTTTAGRRARVRLIGYRRNRRGSAFRRGRHVRMTADEATTAAQDVLLRAQEVTSISPISAEEASAQIAALDGLAAEAEMLAAETYTDGTPEGDQAAYDLIAQVQQALDEMLAAARQAEEALLGDGSDVALEPVI